MIKLNDEFVIFPNVKEVYLGENKVLGFDTELNYDSSDSRVESSGVSRDNWGYYSFINTGFIKVNAACSKLRIGLLGIVDPGGVRNGLDIYLKNFFTDEILFRYRISCVWYSSLSNFTLRCELYKGNSQLLSSGEWNTDYAFGSHNYIEYDFETGQYKFPILGSYSNHGGGFVSTYTYFSEYVPTKIEVINNSGNTINFVKIDNIVVQN